MFLVALTNEIIDPPPYAHLTQLIQSDHHTHTGSNKKSTYDFDLMRLYDNVVVEAQTKYGVQYDRVVLSPRNNEPTIWAPLH